MPKPATNGAAPEATRPFSLRLPVGFVWGKADGKVLLHPDEAVVTAIRTIFARFAETGSARRVWLWFRDRGHKLSLQMHAHAGIGWACAASASGSCRAISGRC